MNWPWNWFKPPPFRYWLTWNNPKSQLLITKSRFAPDNDGVGYNFHGSILIDGPFESQEEAVHALTFWRLQYQKGKAGSVK